MLALSDKDEQFIDKVTEQLIRETNQVFGEGLKVDEIFEQLERAVTRSLDSLSQEDQEKKLNGKGSVPPDSSAVVLF